MVSKKKSSSKRLNKKTSKKKGSSKKDLAYIKIEFDEEFEGKKRVLESQAGLLKSKKSVKNYLALRKAELKSKLRLKKDLKEFKKYLNDLTGALPNPEVPRFVKEHEEKSSPRTTDKEIIVKKPKSNKIEQELEDIQRKLKEMEIR
ncbi:MAG: hypothetical protein ACOCUU_02205 [Nanoarchaeota archaeon]